MSNRSFALTFVLAALLTSVVVLNSQAAATVPAPGARTMVSAAAADNLALADLQEASLTCGDILCHNTAECSSGTTPCGVCVIPPGGFFGHCVRK